MTSKCVYLKANNYCYDSIGEVIRNDLENRLNSQKMTTFTYKLNLDNRVVLENKLIIKDKDFCYDTIGEWLRVELEDKLPYNKDCTLTYLVEHY